jgi:DNA-binding winged helix-turn-helix (wHTH) protein/TolB-like protein
MKQPLPSVFRLGPFRVDATSGEIDGPHGLVRLHPRAMSVLVFLAERPGCLVTRDQLLESVWADENVNDHVLTHAISEIRHGLRDQAQAPAIIQTLPKRGYRLLAPVGPLPVPATPSRPGGGTAPLPEGLQRRGGDGSPASPGLWEELRRRRVVRVALAYMVFAWLATEVAATVFPILHVPDWAVTFVVVSLALGFPVSVALAWAFDLDGRRVRRASREPPAATPLRFLGSLAVRATLLVLCTGVLAANLLTTEAGDAIGLEQPGRRAVAVEPFAAAGRIVKARALSRSLTEEVRLRLAAVSGMQVRAAGQPAEFSLHGLVNVMNGRVRVIVRLTENGSGDQLWAAEAEAPLPESPDAWRRLVDDLTRQFRSGARAAGRASGRNSAQVAATGRPAGRA